MAEVPTTLAKDGRDRPPHLRTWRDGWRHLRFLLLFAPRWLFLYPGSGLAALSALQLVVAMLHPQGLGRWPVGIHTQLFAAAGIVLGYQTMLFAIASILARSFTGLVIVNQRERWVLRLCGSPWLWLGGLLLSVSGLVLCVSLAWQWGSAGFGALSPDEAMRIIIPGVALLLVGTQSVLAAVFFAAMRSAFELRSTSPVLTA